MQKLRSVITGTGSYIPSTIKKNKDFGTSEFYAEDSSKITTAPEEVIKKFHQITGIAERRYITDDLNASQIATIAAQKAIESAGIDPENIDQIIVAHNYGDTESNSVQPDAVPSLGSRVKNRLGIKNPYCIPYDILFGCPGWIQGLIQANIFIQAGAAKCCLIIGTETLSRVVDAHDRDSMIFSDGAGACIVEGRKTTGQGILSSAAVSHSQEELNFINCGKSYCPDADPKPKYIKMRGRKVYEYAISNVPPAMKSCLEKADIKIEELNKVFIHQANEKLDDSIIKRFYKLFNINQVPEKIMPMSIHTLGNSSVATVPTLYDMVKRGKVEGHHIKGGDVILFASVGAGMNINAICYRV